LSFASHLGYDLLRERRVYDRERKPGALPRGSLLEGYDTHLYALVTYPLGYRQLEEIMQELCDRAIFPTRQSLMGGHSCVLCNASVGRVLSRVGAICG
jgi:hypothetical protein